MLNADEFCLVLMDSSPSPPEWPHKLGLTRLIAHRHSCLSRLVVCFWCTVLNGWINYYVCLLSVCFCGSLRISQRGRCQRVAPLPFEINGSLRGKLPGSWQVLIHAFSQSISTLFKVLIKWLYLWNLLTEVLWLLSYSTHQPEYWVLIILPVSPMSH